MRALVCTALALLALGGCSLTRPEEQPAYVKATAVEGRVERIEHQNEGLLELQRQLEAAQAELRQQRGELEQLGHELKASQAREHDLYADLDRRLTALDARAQAPATAPGAAPTSVARQSSFRPCAGPPVWKRSFERHWKRTRPGATIRWTSCWRISTTLSRYKRSGD